MQNKLNSFVCLFFLLSVFRGKVVLGYSETELCMKGSGYQFIHAADMMYCADSHIRSMLTHTPSFQINWSLMAVAEHIHMVCCLFSVVALQDAA